MTRKVSPYQVFRFVWPYWTKRAIQFIAILSGIFLGIFLEVKIPEFASELVLNVKSVITENIDTVNIRMTVVSAKGFVRMVRLVNNNPIMTPDGINHVP